MSRTVAIDFSPPFGRTFDAGDAVVVVDVIRATTTATTAAAMGRRCWPVPSVGAARIRARGLERPLLVGEVAGRRPEGFALTNSPCEVAAHADVSRPMVLLSTSGTRLLDQVRHLRHVYLGCLRNHGALGRHVAGRHRRVTLLGAATRGEFREEDQMCCALIAGALVKAGFAVENPRTAAFIERWAGAPRDAFLESRSVEYLRSSHQLHDLDFILDHFDDLRTVFGLRGGEVVAVGEAPEEIAE